MRYVDHSSYGREDILDTRDLEKRIDELEGEEELEPEEADELKDLLEAREYISEWRHGETLIADSYFVNYAKELAVEVGAISGKEKWPCDCIDWEKAARELRMDYSEVEICGHTFWVRN